MSHIIDHLLVKLASRCDLKCKYCYWFRDEEVLNLPPKLTLDAEFALLHRLEEHINNYNFKKFSLIFHGGEPLMFGKKRFIDLLLRLELLAEKTGCDLHLSMTSNGVSLDEEWVQILKTFNVPITISIDGPQTVHDANRVDHKGRGSFQRVVNAINLLKKNNLIPGIIAVCSPANNPEDLFNFFVNELEIIKFDILIPDSNHHDNIYSIKDFYKKLIDLWWAQYLDQGVKIRILEGMITGILGGESDTQSIGYGPITTTTILTDGSIEPIDVLRIAGHEQTNTSMSLFTHQLQQIIEHPKWQIAYDASLNLCDKCNSCEFKKACGGGSLSHRWSKTNGYNNPSVYCDDLKDIFHYLASVIAPSLNFSVIDQALD